MHRRSLLRSAGAIAGGGLATLAGCTSDDGTDDGEGATYVPTEPNYRGWFDDVGTYEGTVDSRGQDEARVMVGTRGSSGYYKFDPPAVAVSPGTTVVWEWTGKGGTHNVRETEDVFDSGRPVDEDGHTFEHTLERPGIYRYVCEPHRSLGMKGAVFVALGEAGT